jgi:hypothetical protein
VHNLVGMLSNLQKKDEKSTIIRIDDWCNKSVRQNHVVIQTSRAKSKQAYHKIRLL